MPTFTVSVTFTGHKEIVAKTAAGARDAFDLKYRGKTAHYMGLEPNVLTVTDDPIPLEDIEEKSPWPSGYTHPACETCGSPFVKVDAWATWNGEEWEAENTFDDAMCSSCEDRDALSSTRLYDADKNETRSISSISLISSCLASSCPYRSD